MHNIFRDLKIKKELKKYEKFKNSYNFTQKDVKIIENQIFCDDICIKDGDLDWVGETDSFVNVGFKIHGNLPKILSNLFPYRFYFKGNWYNSIEGFFQGIKFKNKKAQKLVFSMYGTMSNNIKGAQDYDWQQNQTIFFKGKAFKRDSKQYEHLVNELYVALLQNPLYVDALKAVGNKYILHAMGETSMQKTVFSRYEFELQLNCLKDYCLRYK